MVVTLCINLPDAHARWKRVQRDVVPRLPPDVARLHRIEAVDGRALDPADPAVPLSPLCRWHLLERHRVCNGMEIDSLGAVGCTLSHVRCWRWILDHAVPYALVLEDDSCLSAEFARLWQPPSPDVDLLVLGYLWRDDAGLFFGSHCYVVTARGARRLLDAAFPIQLHVDVFMASMLRVGAVTGHVCTPSRAQQCVLGTIGHYDAVVGYKRALPVRSDPGRKKRNRSDRPTFRWDVCWPGSP